MSRLMRQAADTKYEAVGMNLGQAMQVAEFIGNGSVIWSAGHCYPGSGVVLRPVGCMCPACSYQRRGFTNEANAESMPQKGLNNA